MCFNDFEFIPDLPDLPAVLEESHLLPSGTSSTRAGGQDDASSNQLPQNILQHTVIQEPLVGQGFSPIIKKHNKLKLDRSYLTVFLAGAEDLQKSQNFPITGPVPQGPSGDPEKTSKDTQGRPKDLPKCPNDPPVTLKDAQGLPRTFQKPQQTLTSTPKAPAVPHKTPL